MALHRNGFEGQTPNGNATAANSAASGDAYTSQSITGGSAVYTNARAAQGSLSLLITPGTSQAAFFDDATFNSTSMVVSDCFYYSGAPSVNNTVIVDFRDSSNLSHTQVVLTTAGKLTMIIVGGTQVATATTSLVAGHWYRIEAQIFSDASAGTVAYQYYLDNTGSAVESKSASALNTRGGAMNVIRRGCTSTTFAASLPYWNYDNIQARDGTLTPIGTYVPATPPTASFTHSQTGLTLNVNGSGSSAVAPATISSYDWSFGDTATGTGSTTSHTYSGNGTYTVALTVTDSNGLTNSTSQTVTFAVRLPELYAYSGGQWVASVLYTYSGGQWIAVR